MVALSDLIAAISVAPSMVHLRSKQKRIERKFRQFLYQLSLFDTVEKETIFDSEDATVPILEIADTTDKHRRYCFKVTSHATIDVAQGEVLRDRFGRGTLDT